MPQRELKTLPQLFGESAQAVKRNLTLFIFLNTVTILGTAWDIGLDIRDKSHPNSWGQSFIPSFGSTGNAPRLNAGLVAALAAVGFILYLILEVLAVRAANHKIVRFSEVWRVFRAKWWKILLVEIMFFAIVGVGLIALVVPGLYLISRLAFWPIIIIDQDISIRGAFDKSWEITRNSKMVTLTTLLFGFILGLPSIVPVVGPLVATVLTIAYSVAVPMRYFELKQAVN